MGTKTQPKSPVRERKSLRSFITKIDSDAGIVDHIVSVFGIEDLGGDVVHPGAFVKTITERFNKIRVLDQHDTWSIMSAIGKPLAMREISKSDLPEELLSEYPEATGGLLAQTQFLMDTAEGKGAFSRIKAGAIDEWSFGYDAMVIDFSSVDGESGRDEDRRTVRNLREIRMWEYSPVLWGMNPATVTLGSKSDEEPGESEQIPEAMNQLETTVTDLIGSLDAINEKLDVLAGDRAFDRDDDGKMVLVDALDEDIHVEPVNDSDNAPTTPEKVVAGPPDELPTLDDIQMMELELDIALAKE